MTYTQAIRALGTVNEGLSEQPGLQTEVLRVLAFLRKERRRLKETSPRVALQRTSKPRAEIGSVLG